MKISIISFNKIINVNIDFESQNIIESEDIANNKNADRREEFIESTFVAEKNDSNNGNNCNNKK